MLTRSLVVLGIVALAACEPETAGGVAEGGKSGTGASGGTSGTGGTGGTSGTGGSVGGNAGSTGGGAGRAGSGGSAGATAPSVSFVSPADGATLENPVTFVIAAVGADEVEVFADETYSLGPAWDPSKKSELRYRFGGTGFPRPIHVSARKDGAEVARDDISITIEPDPCEVQFFLKKFDENNSGSDLFEPREQTLAAVQAEVASLQACGAAVTLGGMMSLLLYEGAFRLGAYNTLCEENSYNQTTTNCDADPEALYSYQFGLGAIHTSNFHPCKGGAWTQSMRTLLEDELEKSGFSVASSLLTADDKARFAQICPGVTPSGIDHFILAAHAAYAIPKDAKGNLIEQFGKFPLFDAATSIRLSLNPIRAQCSSIDSDGEAIAVWGGGDPSYSDPAKQQQVLAYFQNFAATCN